MTQSLGRVGHYNFDQHTANMTTVVVEDAKVKSAAQQNIRDTDEYQRFEKALDQQRMPISAACAVINQSPNYVYKNLLPEYRKTHGHVPSQMAHNAYEQRYHKYVELVEKGYTIPEICEVLKLSQSSVCGNRYQQRYQRERKGQR